MKRTSVPVRSVSPVTRSGSTVSPPSKRATCSCPSRQMVNSSQSDSALTTLTPTPCRPPETL